jgi:putative hemolysin
MTVLAVSAPSTGAARYTLRIAADATEIAAAQRLRHRVFAEELGATLHTPVPGHDVDEFDAYCDHLIVVEDGTGEVVGTYRMLPPGRTTRRYSAGEFDVAALAGLDADLVETGRSCVHGAHRAGAVINLMWAGIARYMHLTGHRWLAGCASVGLSDGGDTVAGVWDLAQRRHLAPAGYRVTPHVSWPIRPAPPGRVAVPPLLRGYLRLGAWICGPPAHDPNFDCADFYVLLGMDRLDPRYLRHFLGDSFLGDSLHGDSLRGASLHGDSLRGDSLHDASGQATQGRGSVA